MKNIKYNEQSLREAVKYSNTYVDVFRYLKLCTTNYNFLKKKLKEYNIDVSHFNQSNSRKNKVKYKLEELLVKNGHPISSGDLKNKLYNNNIKHRKCELCGQDELWNNMKISLILDHIDGDRYNNEFSNLRIVCPNCNAGLDTHCGKNKKYIKKEKIKKESEYNKKLTERINNILKANIDFTQRGWRLKVEEITGIQPQRADKFIIKYFPELKDILYKHKDKK
jgi:hypothetical protein